MNRNPVSIIIGFVLLLVFGVLLFVFQVRQSEVAVVTTFGKPTRDLREPGPYLRLPWPIQKVYHFDKRVQSYEGKQIEDLTQDNNNIIVQPYVGWRITDAKLFFTRFKDGSVAEAEKLLEDMVKSAKSGIIGKHPLSDFVSADHPVKFTEIENEIRDAVHTRLVANQYGVDVDFVGIKQLKLPETVTKSVFDRMKAERGKIASESESEGKAQAQIIRSAADRDAAQILAEAEAKSKRIRGEGEAEAAKTLPVFQQEPELASFLLRLDALGASLNDRTTLILDQKNPPFDLLAGTTNAVNKVR